MKIAKYVATFACLLVLAACGESKEPERVAKPTSAAPKTPPPPPKNVVSRDDIIDFCDSIPQRTGDDDSATERSTMRAAEMLGADSEQIAAMNYGATMARFGHSMAAVRSFGGSLSPDDEKSFQSICKAKVREELYKLTEK